MLDCNCDDWSTHLWSTTLGATRMDRVCLHLAPQPEVGIVRLLPIPRLLLLALALMFTAQSVLAQQACSRSLEVPRRTLDLRQAMPFVDVLDSVTTAQALARRGGVRSRGAIGHQSPVRVPDSLPVMLGRALVQSDGQRELATALALIVRGERAGFSSDQAVVAADLYVGWRLPPEPAEILLADPLEDFWVRDRALFILRSRPEAPQLREYLRSAFCAIAARADGLGRFVGRVAAQQSGIRILNPSERQFLLQLVQVVAERRLAGRPPLRLREIVIPSNPLATELQRLVPGDW